MSLPVSNLTPDSSDKETKDAINDSFAICMKEPGKTQEQCAGMIYGIAREKTGRELQGAKQR